MRTIVAMSAMSRVRCLPKSAITPKVKRGRKSVMMFAIILIGTLVNEHLFLESQFQGISDRF